MVKSIVETDMLPAEISELIDRTDVRIQGKINVGITPALFLEDLSATWTALRVMLKDANAHALGEYSERRDVAMRMLREEVDDMLANPVTTAGSTVVKIIAAMEPI
jgi:hypothetical protein